MPGIFKIRNKYILKNLIDFIPLNNAISIFKYCKKVLNIMELSKAKIKIYLLLAKIVKPLANIEDYIPTLMKKINCENINSQKEEYLIILFCEYLNKNNKFIPNVNFYYNYKKMYDSLNNLKISYNINLIESFFNEEYTFEINEYKLFKYTNLYAKKIKEVSFLDTDFVFKNENRGNEVKISSFTIIKFLMHFSNIDKIEDRYYEDDDNTRFLDLFGSEYNITKYLKKYKDSYPDGKNIKEVNDIIKGLKSYSIYFDNYDNFIVKSVCENILNIGQNIEELEITAIQKSESIYFINALKKLTKLNSLAISTMSNDNNLYNQIASIVNENSLIILEVNVYNFEEVLKIINKNKESLQILTIKINNNKDNNLLIIKTISKIENLLKLKIISIFPIIDKVNIDYFSLKKVYDLQISLNVINELFDFNFFFQKIPNLRKIHFHGINFDNNEFTKLNEYNIRNMKLHTDIFDKIKKIKFSYGKESSSLFISMFIKNYPNKNNIEKISIENCIFGNKTVLNEIINNLLLFSNLISLKLDYLNFKNKKTKSKINYEKLAKLKNIEKFSFLGLKDNKLNMTLTSLISLISENFRYINEIGFSINNLDSHEINSILLSLKKIKYLNKVRLFNNYCTKNCNIWIGKIYDYFMIDLKNINFYLCYDDNEFDDSDYDDFDINNVYQTKVRLLDYFNINDLTKNEDDCMICNNTKKEEFYIYQNIFSHYIINYYGLCIEFSDKKSDFVIKMNEDHTNSDDEEDSFLYKYPCCLY